MSPCVNSFFDASMCPSFGAISTTIVETSSTNMRWGEGAYKKHGCTKTYGAHVTYTSIHNTLETLRAIGLVLNLSFGTYNELNFFDHFGHEQARQTVVNNITYLWAYL